MQSNNLLDDNTRSALMCKLSLKFNNREQHLINDARFLPCKLSACNNCIINGLYTKNESITRTTTNFKCVFDECYNHHSLLDLYNLPQDTKLMKLLSDNVINLASEALIELKRILAEDKLASRTL